MTDQALDLLFNENTEDKTKVQSYKDTFKEFELPSKYYMLEMYNKQKELQQFLADRRKTSFFPSKLEHVEQRDVQLAIYHLFCMQVEFAELREELNQLAVLSEKDANYQSKLLDARYELIDMFFFMFNVGIYTGLNMQKVVDTISRECVFHDASSHGKQICTDIGNLNYAVAKLMNYIDKLPWKAWKEYDYKEMYSRLAYEDQVVQEYASAIHAVTEWSKLVFAETDESLFNLYMNKWEENHRRQLDINAGYVLNKEAISSAIDEKLGNL